MPRPADGFRQAGASRQATAQGAKQRYWPPFALRNVLLVTVAALLLGGCASWFEEQPDDDWETEEVDERPIAADDPDATEDPRAVERRRVEEARARGLDLDDPLEAALLDEPHEIDNPLAVRRVHFAFDSSEVRDEYLPVLEAHGRYLAEHPQRRMTIEGHTDERGSREYNLALGERRAESVMRLLLANGAERRQLEVVSYGEEDPLVSESNEEAWAQNRRAELLYD
ncbi:peptidoglycan-associated lipoprotein [Halorhodospira abdelmalekii]|nr:peptidoglycan-associated lipoprotein Pal [Halorhodospira abdelmalekii]MBK1734654.1 peptidoglycan-associated lipoprotein [Halorhodospira abdelmalekii]